MNKKRLLIIILVFTFLLIFGIYLFNKKNKYNSLVVSNEKYEEIKQSRMESNGIKIENIKFNDYSILIDEDKNTLYYSMIDNSSKYNPTVKYDTKNYKVVVSEEITEEKVNNNNMFKLMIYDDSKYHEYNLIVTSLPILNITYEENTKKDKRIPIELYLFDNRNNAHKKVLNSRGDLNIINSDNDKKNYTFSLISESLGRNERENNVSILGMQRHSEYLLNSLYDDEEKIRNVFTTNLWNEMSFSKNDNSEYVELFINNHYVGLYSLGYNIEKETLNLKNDEFLFFKNDFVNSEEKYETTTNLDGYISYNKVLQNQIKKNIDKRQCNGANCPKIDSYKELKKYYENLLSGDIEKIKMVSNLENSADLYLLYLFTQSSSNVSAETFSNTYLAFRRNSNSYFVEFIPWNMNYTFGHIVNQENNYKENVSDNSYVMKYNPITILLELGDNDTKELVKEKYKKLRDNILSEENINKLLNNYEDKIFNSGAYLRDSLNWNKDSDNNLPNNLENFKEYVTERLKYMDEFINNL